jgi:hypothetical protein
MLASLAISCSADPRTDTAIDDCVPLEEPVALTAEAIAEMSDMPYIVPGTARKRKGAIPRCAVKRAL